MANRFYKNSKVIAGKYYQIPKFVRKNVDFSDISGEEFVVQEGDRLDIIAEQVYGDPRKWKELALYNKTGYFFDLKPGDVIMLPHDIKKITKRL